MASYPFDYGLAYLNPTAWAAADIRILWITADSTLYTDPEADRGVQYLGDINAPLGEFAGDDYPSTPAARWTVSSGAPEALIDTGDHVYRFSTSEGVLNKTAIAAASSGSNHVVGYLFIDNVGDNDATSPVIGYHDLYAAGQSFQPSGGNVNTTWDPEGIGKLSATTTT